MPKPGGDDLDRIYLEFVGPIRNYLHRLSGDAALAEDLVEEVFYRAMRQFVAGARVTYISAWLYRIARNLYLDHCEKDARRAGLSLEQVNEVRPEVLTSRRGLPEAEALRAEQRVMIAEAIDRLPENQRSALILRDVHGLSYEEIAEVMGMTVGAVKSCLFRARRQFMGFYEPYRRGEG